MLVGFPPFFASSVPEFTKNVQKGVYPIPKFLHISFECLDFIDKCLRINPEERLFGDSLKNHPFLTGKQSEEFKSDSEIIKEPLSTSEVDETNAYFVNAGSHDID